MGILADIELKLKKIFLSTLYTNILYDTNIYMQRDNKQVIKTQFPFHLSKSVYYDSHNS